MQLIKTKLLYVPEKPEMYLSDFFISLSECANTFCLAKLPIYWSKMDKLLNVVNVNNVFLTKP